MTGTSITRKGLQLITKILASGQELNFTRAAVGAGRVLEGYDKENMIGLVNYKMDGMISKCVSENQQAEIVVQMSSVGVTEGFTVTEAGIFAQDPDEGEILYAYIDMTEDPQYIYPEDSEISKFMELTLVVVVGSVEKVSAYINPDSFVNTKEFYELKKEIEDGQTAIEFNTAEKRENIESGETLSILFGKIKKWFADLKAAAFAGLANNCTTTVEGYALDARQGKALQDEVNEINSNLGNAQNKLNNIRSYFANPNNITVNTGGTDYGDVVTLTSLPCGMYIVSVRVAVTGNIKMDNFKLTLRAGCGTDQWIQTMQQNQDTSVRAEHFYELTTIYNCYTNDNTGWLSLHLASTGNTVDAWCEMAAIKII